MKYKDLAFIILNYNNYQLTIKSVNNILSFNYDSKIIIIDNGSKNESWDILTQTYKNINNIFLIKNDQNIGYARGNNIGLKAINNLKYVVIMNPDIEIPNINVVDVLYQTLENNDDIALITAITEYNGTINNPNECAWVYPTKSQLFLKGTLLGLIFKTKNLDINISKNSSNIIYADVLQGCFFMSRYDVLHNINYFDENTFLYFEENILAKKIDKIGMKKAVATKIHINHNHFEKEKFLNSRTNKAFDSDCYHDSKIYYINKYSGFSKLFCVLSTAFNKFDKTIKHLFYFFLYNKNGHD